MTDRWAALPSARIVFAEYSSPIGFAERTQTDTQSHPFLSRCTMRSKTGPSSIIPMISVRVSRATPKSTSFKTRLAVEKVPNIPGKLRHPDGFETT
jgi:hypothetical protein